MRWRKEPQRRCPLLLHLRQARVGPKAKMTPRSIEVFADRHPGSVFALDWRRLGAAICSLVARGKPKRQRRFPTKQLLSPHSHRASSQLPLERDGGTRSSSRANCPRGTARHWPGGGEERIRYSLLGILQPDRSNPGQALSWPKAPLVRATVLAIQTRASPRQ